MLTSPALHDHITDELIRQGWVVTPNFLSQQTIETLADELTRLRQANALRPAGVGKGTERKVNTKIRGDFIKWLSESHLTAAQRTYYARLEELRLAVNAELQLGLFEFEGHLATYPPGSFYSKHLDRFKSDNLRALTCILYLNHEWQVEDGGQLRVYTEEDRYFDVIPQGGTLMTFLSNHFWHEVLPASRERMSITGWFKTRSEVTP